MRGKSHCCLGNYLAEHYLSEASPLNRRAFLLGCIEPDRNPVTYLKGSLRHQWLRGHNYLNAKRFMARICRRLERKKSWNLFDYYAMGKLIHYTADAFTYAHNEIFPTNLDAHMEYEAALQEHFLSYVQRASSPQPASAGSIMDYITSFHSLYRRIPANIHTDARFTFHVCCGVLAVLLVKPVPIG